MAEPLPAETTTEPPKKDHTLRNVVTILAVIIIVGLVVKFLSDSVALASSCYGQSQKYIQDLDPIYNDWRQTVVDADGVDRKSIGTVITDLEYIRKRARAVEYPPCARLAHTELIYAMDDIIDAFNAYKGNKGDSIVQKKMDASAEHLSNFTDAIDDISASKP